MNRWGTATIVAFAIGLLTRVATITIGARDRWLADSDVQWFMERAGDAEAGTPPAMELLLAGSDEMYVGILGVVFRITGVHAEVAELLNVLLSAAAIVLTIAAADKVLDRAGASLPLLRPALVGVWALEPLLVLYSTVPLREAFVSLFIAIGVYFSIDATLRSNLLAGLAYVAAAAFHSGAIVLLLGPVLLIGGNLLAGGRLGRRQLLTVGGAIVVVLASIPLWIGKLLGAVGAESVSDISLDRVLGSAERTRRGNTAYTVPFADDGGLVGLLASPLRALAFLLQPVPWDWRDLRDVVAWVGGAAITAVLVLAVIRFRRLEARYRRALVIPLLAFVFTYGLATNNAGTATRHRLKAWPMVMVTVAAVAVARPRERTPASHDVPADSTASDLW